MAELPKDIAEKISSSTPASREALLMLLGWPPALIKASCDEFDYALKLRTGQVVRFSYARFVDATWVGLDGIKVDREYQDADIEHSCPRGVDVRLADIVWVADAPDGS